MPILLLQLVVLIAPIILALRFLRRALRSRAASGEEQRAAPRGFFRFVVVVAVAAWCAIWDFHGKADLIATIVQKWPRAIREYGVGTALFWIPPVISLGIALVLTASANKTVLRLKWTFADTIWQTTWRLVSFVIPLLLVSVGISALLDRNVRGVGWLIFAGIVAKVGTGFLRRAEGLRLNTLKSGESRNRALRIADGMGVTLRKVFVVPAGKGHLTNAYGMSSAVALTDNLGKYLTKAEIEYVVAHEVSHVKLKHARKNLAAVIAIYAAVSIVFFQFSHQLVPLKPALQILGQLGPLIVVYFCSRKFEYAADKAAVAYTGEPKIAIQALKNLYKANDAPAELVGFTEIFTTHPTIANRCEAIAKGWQLSEGGYESLRR